MPFDAEIRRVICTTNAIESVNARIRKAVRARGHFPNEQAALKCVYLAVMSLDPTGQRRARWTNDGRARSTPRHHLQRPTHRRSLTQNKTTYTEFWTDPIERLTAFYRDHL